MGLFDSLKKKDIKLIVKFFSIKKEVKGERVFVFMRMEVEVIFVEEDVFVKEFVKFQFRYLYKIIVISYLDFEKVFREFQNGNIVFVDLIFFEKRFDVFEKVVQQFKGMVSVFDGQVVKVCKYEIKFIFLLNDIRIVK